MSPSQSGHVSMSRTPKNIPRVSVCLTVAFLVATCLPLFAQVEETSDRDLDLRSVRELRQQIEDNDSLEAGLKTQLLNLYDPAIGDLESAAQAEARVGEYQRERSNIEARVQTLRSEVNRAERRVRPSLPQNQSAEQVESALARELSLLASLRLSLRDAEARAEERVRRRSEIANQLGTLDPQIESLTDALRSPAESGLSEQLKEAARTRLLARRQALLSQRDALRAELAWVEEQAVLIPWQRDQAELRVTRSEELLTLMDAVLQELRRDEAQRALEELRLRSGEITQPRGFAERAQEIEQLAEALWAPEGVMAQSLLADVALANTRKSLVDLERILQLTRRRFEAVGHRGDITQWYPESTSDFPGIPETSSEIRRLETLIPNLQHQLIQYEQERVRFREFENNVSILLEEIQSTESGSLTPEMESLIWDLVRTRRGTARRPDQPGRTILQSNGGTGHCPAEFFGPEPGTAKFYSRKTSLGAQCTRVHPPQFEGFTVRPLVDPIPSQLVAPLWCILPKRGLLPLQNTGFHSPVRSAVEIPETDPGAAGVVGGPGGRYRKRFLRGQPGSGSAYPLIVPAFTAGNLSHRECAGRLE